MAPECVWPVRWPREVSWGRLCPKEGSWGSWDAGICTLQVQSVRDPCGQSSSMYDAHGRIIPKALCSLTTHPGTHACTDCQEHLHVSISDLSHLPRCACSPVLITGVAAALYAQHRPLALWCSAHESRGWCSAHVKQNHLRL